MRRQYRRGRCPRCSVHWSWRLKVLLRDMKCPECGGGLKRIERRTDTKKLTPISVEGYQPVGKAVVA